MTPFQISDAGLEDVGELARLEQLVFVASDGLISQRAFRRHIQGGKNILLVAKSPNVPGLLAGYILVLVHKLSARIYSVAVNPDCRGLGIGRNLILSAMDRVGQKGITTLRLEVRRENSTAIRLYRSLGFTQTGIRPDYYATGSDAVLMKWKKEE